MINTKKYYNEWHGHPVNDLQKIIKTFRGSKRGLVWLAGDSSLDNKAWIIQSTKTEEAYTGAINGYENILSTSKMVKDISYFINANLDKNFVCINTAVEATTLVERINNGLLRHDILIAENIQKDDVLIVSVGGNDVAFNPNSILGGVLQQSLFNQQSADAIMNIFGNNVQEYINLLVNKCKPYLVIVCMIYYPDMDAKVSSWANEALFQLGYNDQPAVIQEMIHMVYNNATCKIKIPGVERVIPFPMFKVLDGKDSSMYEQRVEPSAKGSELIAKELTKIIRNCK